MARTLASEILPVLLADPHVLVRTGLRRLLEEAGEVQVVAEAGSVKEVLEQVQALRPRVSIRAVTLTDGSGIEACQQIVADCPYSSVLMLSAFAWDVYLARAWRAGAAGFLIKTTEPKLFLEAVRAVARGERLFSHEQLRHIWAWQQAVTQRLERLTPREAEVAALVVSGYTNPELAEALTIAEKTVETHVSNVLGKLEMRSRRELIAWARRTRAFAP